MAPVIEILASSPKLIQGLSLNHGQAQPVFMFGFIGERWEINFVCFKPNQFSSLSLNVNEYKNYGPPLTRSIFGLFCLPLCDFIFTNVWVEEDLNGSGINYTSVASCTVEPLERNENKLAL